MTQRQLMAFENTCSSEEVALVRSRVGEALCKTLDSARLWNDMYKRRVMKSRTFEYDALAEDAKNWVLRLLHYQNKHRRAI
jgi:hypothetical protein